MRKSITYYFILRIKIYYYLFFRVIHFYFRNAYGVCFSISPLTAGIYPSLAWIYGFRKHLQWAIFRSCLLLRFPHNRSRRSSGPYFFLFFFKNDVFEISQPTNINWIHKSLAINKIRSEKADGNFPIYFHTGLISWVTAFVET